MHIELNLYHTGIPTTWTNTLRRPSSLHRLSKKPLIVEELKPGPDCVTDEQFLEFARNNGSTVFHPCGTNRMGVDEKAVVDPELRVHGLSGLRVVDASVMPMVPSSNIHPATIMVAEKGSDLIGRSLRS